MLRDPLGLAPVSFFLSFLHYHFCVMLNLLNKPLLILLYHKIQHNTFTHIYNLTLRLLNKY